MSTSNYLSNRVNNLKVGIPQYTDLEVAAEITGSIKSHTSLYSISASPQVITDKCSIPDNYYASSYGPLTIAEGGIVEVGENSIWKITSFI